MTLLRRLPALLLAILVGCDRAPQASPTLPPLPPVFDLELEPVSPLHPHRATHVAVDSLGNVCWVQESDSGDDVMFIIGEGGIPRVTELTTRRIVAALNAPEAAGNIQSLSAGRGGDVYFYFRGSHGRRLLACFGTFNPRSGQLRVLANTDALMSATGMGVSLGLARGKVVSNSSMVWLWIRHTDDWSLFRMRHGEAGSGSARLAESRMTLRWENGEVHLNEDGHDLSAGAGENLYWLDGGDAALREIDGSGAVKLVRSLIGLPVSLSLPSRDASGRVVLFAAAAPLREPTHERQLNATPIEITPLYPAMLIFDGERTFAAPRLNIRVYPGFGVQRLRLPELAPEPQGQSWIAYDVSSGELLRLRLKQRGTAAD